MQEMLGADRPDYGHIFDDMIHEEGEPIATGPYIAPRVEFEIAFVLKADIDGETVTVETVREAIDYVVPAVEIIDSRIRAWKRKFEDTVADNGSSAGAVFCSGRVELEAVVWLSRALHQYGISLKKGEKILAGALTKAVDVESGDHFRATFEGLGEVEVIFS